jgi:hypothetical protein
MKQQMAISFQNVLLPLSHIFLLEKKLSTGMQYFILYQDVLQMDLFLSGA